jgi:ectoine hydroxylase-related dioxygenase (phytanoyl-CoA dioxygenase family)
MGSRRTASPRAKPLFRRQKSKNFWRPSSGPTSGPASGRGSVSSLFAICLKRLLRYGELAGSPAIRHLIEPVLGAECYPVRGILFDKVPGANWKVPWHQDVTIAVQNRIEAEGFGPWSIKVDVLHVQPPAAVLEQMLSLRLHLDPCGEGNGALRVIPGSHRWGRIAEGKIPSIREASHEHACLLGIGDVLLMRPLLLHASSASCVPDHRRVIHLDFAAAQLPPGMGWFSELNPST